MYRNLFLIVTCTLLSSYSYCQESTSSAFVVSQLIEDGLFENKNEIFEKSKGLEVNQKYMIYDEYEKNAGVPFACNLFLGLGIGSFIQGDRVGGLTALSGELIGFGSMLLGSTMTETVYDYYYDEYSTELSPAGAGFMTFGLVLFLSTRIYELIRPFSFENDYNKTLKRSLRFYELSFNVINKDKGKEQDYQILATFKIK